MNSTKHEHDNMDENIRQHHSHTPVHVQHVHVSRAYSYHVQSPDTLPHIPGIGGRERAHLATD